MYATTPLSFDDAENDCVRRGGHLVAIPDKTANRVLREEAPENCVEAYWIGARIVVGVFSWTNPSIPPIYVNCAAKNGCGPKAAGATFNVRTGLWHFETDQATKQPYICLLTEGANITDTSVTASTCVCEPGWSYLKSTDSCYKVNNEVGKWREHEQKCVDLGGHLTSIHSEQKNTFVKRLAATGMRQPGCDNNTWICWPSVWIGLYRGNKSSDADGPGDEGPFIWSDNSPVDYTKWGTSRPYQDPKPTASSYASLYADPPDASKGYYVEKIVGKWDHSSGRWSSRAGVCKKGKPAQ
ncbi:Protein CLEC-50 [Aphelenchoides avenae]|nr:Protein CLEC-50 [Aphelenchus avenae]